MSNNSITVEDWGWRSHSRAVTSGRLQRRQSHGTCSTRQSSNDQRSLKQLHVVTPGRLNRCRERLISEWSLPNILLEMEYTVLTQRACNRKINHILQLLSHCKRMRLGFLNVVGFQSKLADPTHHLKERPQHTTYSLMGEQQSPRSLTKLALQASRYYAVFKIITRLSPTQPQARSSLKNAIKFYMTDLHHS